MRKGIVVALAVTGSLVVGPAALAATAEPSGFLPGAYTPQHSGHDHGKKSDHHKKHGKWKKDDHHGHGHGGHGHGHGHETPTADEAAPVGSRTTPYSPEPTPLRDPDSHAARWAALRDLSSTGRNERESAPDADPTV